MTFLIFPYVDPQVGQWYSLLSPVCNTILEFCRVLSLFSIIDHASKASDSIFCAMGVGMEGLEGLHLQSLCVCILFMYC